MINSQTIKISSSNTENSHSLIEKSDSPISTNLPTKTYNANETNNSNTASSPSRESPTKVDIEEEQENFLKLTEKIISTKKIDKIQLEAGTTKSIFYDSIDPNVISKWVKLLKDLKVTAVPLNPKTGMGYSLAFYINGERIFVGGGFAGGIIYIKSNKVMLTIDNFSELKSTFDDLYSVMTLNDGYET